MRFYSVIKQVLYFSRLLQSDTHKKSSGDVTKSALLNMFIMAPLFSERYNCEIVQIVIKA